MERVGIHIELQPRQRGPSRCDLGSQGFKLRDNSAASLVGCDIQRAEIRDVILISAVFVGEVVKNIL
jgi:hypothetical protein